VSPSLRAANPAVELYELLLQNRSIFGRLVQVSGYWNPETSRYERGLPERFQNAGLNAAIVRWHHAFFIEWMALSLTQQQNDVMIYWESVGRTPEQAQKIRTLGEAAIPPLVEFTERRAFSQNLAFIQTLLQHEANAASSAA
jgi:hypothetical protein